MSSEADTCLNYVLPKLDSAGWRTEPHSVTAEHTFTAGRIVVTGNRAKHLKQKRVDYLLRYTREFPIAVVEAKADYKLPSTGLQQAKDYAQHLGLKFAYATNGHGIVEFDYLTGLERNLDTFPTPAELWQRLAGEEGISDSIKTRLLTSGYVPGAKTPRYYQQIAINRTLVAILKGQRRVLLTMATGTGKTFMAFQICWRLWNAGWNRDGKQGRRPRMLYLADRNFLVDDPKDKDFAPFAGARHKIENGIVLKSRQMYFATYQAIAEDENRPGLYKEYPRDFFDLILVDECHRGSANQESNWHAILEYFEPAYQLGMTATPLRNDNINTYQYFGAPVYQYSLKQGIADGFLAPYRVHRILTSADAYGWRPEPGQKDAFGYEIPEQEYHTPAFERKLVLDARTQAIARHLTNFLRQTDRFAKTIVFCVDEDHAANMRQALNNLNTDLTQTYPNYVVRITGSEKEIGRGHLSKFQDLETDEPIIVTTSKLLTTGIDIPTCKNVVLVRVINSMTEFKQIIGRGTRVRDDYNKLFFNIIDYTGCATRLFADPEFDGFPPYESVSTIDEYGLVIPGTETVVTPPADGEDETDTTDAWGVIAPDEEDDSPDGPRKYYIREGSVDIVASVTYNLDAQGQRLQSVALTDFTAQSVRTLYRSASELHEHWLDADRRAAMIEALEERGISLATLGEALDQPDADPFDLLCHLAFAAPLRTRRDRAARLRREELAFFDKYSAEARTILYELLDKYAEHGADQLVIPAALKVPPISQHGNVGEIIRLFGGADHLKTAVTELQSLLYAA